MLDSERMRRVSDAAVNIRSARAGDVLSVGLIERESFSDPWGPREFTTALQSRQTIFSVATSGSGIVIGYVIAVVVMDEAEILNLAVHSAHRSAGIGGKLIDSAIAEAAKDGAVAIYLEVRESNHGARRLYESRGFEEVSRRKRYYRHPVEDALVLRLAVQ